MNENNLENGYWEKDNRNPVVASFILVFLIGAIYFAAGSIIVNIFFIIDLAMNNFKLPNLTDDYFSNLKEIYSRFKYPVLISTFFAQFSILLFLTIILFKRWHFKRIKDYFHFKNFDIIAVILSVAGGIFILPAVEFISRISFYFFPVLKKISETTSALFSSRNYIEFLLLVLFIGVTPAICEETLFRGYFQSTLQRKIKEPYSYIITGTIFSLYHQQPLSILALALIGIFLGYIFCRLKSIYNSMFTHFAYNTIIISLVNYNPADNFLPFIFNNEGDFSWKFTIVSTVIFFIITILIYLYSKLKNNHLLKKS